MSTVTASPATPAESGRTTPGTTTPARRELQFTSMEDLLRDIESLAGVPLVAAGGWTPAQNIEHVRMLIRVSRTGTDFRMPLALRVFARLMKSRLLHAATPSGLKTFAPFEPPAAMTFEDALDAFRDEIHLAAQPGAMSQPSPLLGPMTHEQWIRMHCRHAELHFSHIVPEPQP